MSCKTGRSLNEKLEIEVAEIMKLDRCKMTVVLIERFHSEYFLRKTCSDCFVIKQRLKVTCLMTTMLEKCDIM